MLAVISVAFPSGAAPPIVELPVSFEVQNVNRSQIIDPSCLPDGKKYEIKGYLVAPAAQLDDRSDRSITIYLHSATAAGDTVWRMSAVPGYDWAAEMAGLGHSSLVIDLLGWGKSGHPHGQEVCIGGEADILHQIIEQLRSGTYGVDGNAPVPFSRVVVASLSGAALINHAQAYTWNGADGIIIMGWSDPPTGVSFAGVVPRILAKCASGGENVNDDGTGPSGYLYSWPSRDAVAADVLYDADPAVVDAFKASIIRDPCGAITSGGAAILADFAHLDEVTVPVFLVYGAHDKMAPATTAPLQELLYGSDDVTSVVVPGTGHVASLGRTAPQVRAIVSEWLAEREL